MTRMRTSRAVRLLAAAAFAALASTATATAGTDQYKIQRTTAGDAAARAVALTQAGCRLCDRLDGRPGEARPLG